MALQTIVSRELDPADPAVVTIGEFHAGVAHNVIAGTALLSGTVRSLNADTRAMLLESIVAKTKAVGTMHGVTIECQVQSGAPAVVNRGPALQLAHSAAEAVVDGDNIRQLLKANLGGEDFSEFQQLIPGCYVRFGARVAAGTQAPAPTFDFNEGVLPYAASWFAQVAREAGERLSQA